MIKDCHRCASVRSLLPGDPYHKTNGESVIPLVIRSLSIFFYRASDTQTTICILSDKVFPSQLACDLVASWWCQSTSNSRSLVWEEASETSELVYGLMGSTSQCNFWLMRLSLDNIRFQNYPFVARSTFTFLRSVTSAAAFVGHMHQKANILVMFEYSYNCGPRSSKPQP